MDIRSGSTIAPSTSIGTALLVHGGAWDIPPTHFEEHLDGLRQALRRGREMLEAGKAALEVVCETVAVLESHGAFDAGSGSVLTREGTIEMDAGLMEGDTLAYGAVAGVRRIVQPIQLAHRLLKAGGGEARFLIGEGAEIFAVAQGVDLVDNSTLIHPREKVRYRALKARAAYHTSHPFHHPRPPAPRGTVGCVARDQQGRLAAATSTGGTPFRPIGRVGDSPLPGSGFYANKSGAASATGWGEAISAVLLSGRAVDRVATGEVPEMAARMGITHMYEAITNPDGEGGTGGLLLMGRTGQGGWAYSTPRMARGGWSSGHVPWVEI